MQSKRFYAVLVLAAGIVLAALHVSGPAAVDGCFHRLCAARLGVGAVSASWLAALALPYLPARRVAAQPTELTDTNLPPGLLHADDRRAAAGQRSAVGVLGPQTISAYPNCTPPPPGSPGRTHHAGAGRCMAAALRLARP